MLSARADLVSSGRTPPPATNAIRHAITQRLHSFDVPALVDLLLYLGYELEEIEYRSYQGLVRPTQLVQEIEFHDDPPRVVIVVNMGLLAVQTPLPSFILQAVERDHDEKLARFFAFLDHWLLRSRFATLYPERDPTLLPDWERTKFDLLRLLRLKSPSTLHWLFTLFFPELEVVVRRAAMEQDLPAEPVRLGNSVLGLGCSFGGVAKVPVTGTVVALYSDEAYTPTGRLWVEEAERRVRERVLPLLAETDLVLEISLLVRDRPQNAQLAPHHYVGYDALPGGAWHAQRLLLFDGEASKR